MSARVLRGGAWAPCLEAFGFDLVEVPVPDVLDARHGDGVGVGGVTGHGAVRRRRRRSVVAMMLE